MPCSRCKAIVDQKELEVRDGLCVDCYTDAKNQRASEDPRYSDIVEQLRKLKCPNPENWATEQVLNNTPEVQRFDFLRELALLVLPEGDHKYLRGCQHEAACLRFAGVDADNGPYQRLADAGANLGDVVEIARYAQISALRLLTLILDRRTKSGPHLENSYWAIFTGHDGEENSLELLDDLYMDFWHDDVLDSIK